MNRRLVFILALFFVLSLGVTLEKVFSLNTVKLSSPKQIFYPTERNLLLTEADGILPQNQSLQILKQLDSIEIKSHKVERNEWLEKIAKELGINPQSIRSTNDLEDPQLRFNQQILVQNKNGMVHISKRAEPLETVIKKYERLGGKREKILEANPLDEITFIQDGKLYLNEGSNLWIPDARRSYPFLARPVNWLRISSRFGLRRHPITKVRRWHEGYDLVAIYGAPVYAGQEGVVVYTGWLGGYGNTIDIRHTQITTRYGHLSEINVNTGQRVRKKQLIGRVGSTGLSTGPHLHFEVRRNSDGKSVRPGRYLY